MPEPALLAVVVGVRGRTVFRISDEAGVTMVTNRDAGALDYGGEECAIAGAEARPALRWSMVMSVPLEEPWPACPSGVPVFCIQPTPCAPLLPNPSPLCLLLLQAPSPSTATRWRRSRTPRASSQRSWRMRRPRAARRRRLRAPAAAPARAGAAAPTTRPRTGRTSTREACRAAGEARRRLAAAAATLSRADDFCFLRLPPLNCTRCCACSRARYS